MFNLQFSIFNHSREPKHMSNNCVPRRKPGAQPGNINALKHGFYSRLFRCGEITDLEAYEIDGLADEIAMLRVWTRRVMAIGDGVETLDEAIHVLRALGSASLHLSHLLRSQKSLGGTTDEFEQNFLKALDEVQREFKIRK
jgi:hypothetical protein